jgi:hypothetical protein
MSVRIGRVPRRTITLKRQREKVGERAENRQTIRSWFLARWCYSYQQSIDSAPFIQQVRDGRSVEGVLSNIVECEVKQSGGNTVPAKQYWMLINPSNWLLLYTRAFLSLSLSLFLSLSLSLPRFVCLTAGPSSALLPYERCGCQVGRNV